MNFRSRARVGPAPRPDDLPGFGVTGLREDPRTTVELASREAGAAMLRGVGEVGPVTGEMFAARDALRALKQNRKGAAALSALATIPIVGIPLRWLRRGRVATRNAESIVRAIANGEMTAEQGIAKARGISGRFGNEMSEFLREGGIPDDITSLRSLPPDILERAAKRAITGPGDRAALASARAARAAQRAGPTGPAPSALPRVPAGRRVVAAAVRGADGNVYLGLNHGMAQEAAADALRATPKGLAALERNSGNSWLMGSRGFVASDTPAGQIITPEEARAITARSNQTPQLDPRLSQLHSSDIAKGPQDVPPEAIEAAGGPEHLLSIATPGGARPISSLSDDELMEVGRRIRSRQDELTGPATGDELFDTSRSVEAGRADYDARLWEVEAARRRGSGVLGGTSEQLQALETARAAEHAQRLQVGGRAAEAHAAGGSTFDPRTGLDMSGSRRYAVSPFKMREVVLDQPPTPEDLAQYMDANADLFADPGVVLGTWESNGRHFIDATVLVRSKRQAERIGRATGQEGFTFLDSGNPNPERRFVTTTIRNPDPIQAARTRNELLDEMPVFRAAVEREMVRNLTPDEAAQYASANARWQRSWLRAFAMSPTPREWASMIDLGYNARDWYSVSRAAIAQFGKDAPKFTALMAATSPNVPVERNLAIAREIWNRTGGQPVTREQALAMLHEIGAGKAAHTMAPNVARVMGMSADEIARVDITRPGFLSGAKVDPFFANLMGETQRVTLDTHMARAAGTKPSDIGVSSRNGGVSASLRAGTAEFNRLSGLPPIAPAQAQAAVWEPVRTMTRLVSRGQTVIPDVIRPSQAQDIGQFLSQSTPAPQPGPVTPGLMRPEDIEGFVRRIEIAKRAEQQLGPALFGLPPLVALGALGASQSPLFGTPAAPGQPQ